MTTLRGAWGWRLALGGALLGAFASAYLLVDYLGGDSICFTGSGCDEVRASVFAYPLGIPMPAFGLAFYLAAIGLLLIAATRPAAFGIPMRPVTVAWATAGLLVSAVLTGLEVFVIGSLCGWCLLSAAASVVLAVGALRTYPATAGSPARTAKARRQVEAALVNERRARTRFTLIGGGVLGLALVALLAIPSLGTASPSVQPTAIAGRATLGSGPQLVVFSDFQCPACARVAPILEQLANEHSATVVYRYFPLNQIHANADAAARAAEAARQQGRFWELHDRLFATQSTWAGLGPSQAAAYFEQLAGEAGVDIATWRGDLAGAADVVSADLAEAQRLKLPGTPSIFIDGTMYRGSTSLDALRAALAAVADATSD